MPTHTGCFCFPGRDSPCTAVQGSAPISTPLFCPLPPVLTALSWILLLHPCVLPRASSQCLFLWDAVASSLSVQTAFPVASRLGCPFAQSSAGKDGGHSVTELSTDLRHCSCQGKSETQGVHWVHRALTACRPAEQENLVYSYLIKIRQTLIIHVVQPLAPNHL